MNDKNNTHTYATNEDIEVVYNLVNYYKRIPNYATITTYQKKMHNILKKLFLLLLIVHLCLNHAEN